MTKKDKCGSGLLEKKKSIAGDKISPLASFLKPSFTYLQWFAVSVWASKQKQKVFKSKSLRFSKKR